jgi:hypothetical protein
MLPAQRMRKEFSSSTAGNKNQDLSTHRSLVRQEMCPPLQLAQRWVRLRMHMHHFEGRLT